VINYSNFKSLYPSAGYYLLAISQEIVASR